MLARVTLLMIMLLPPAPNSQLPLLPSVRKSWMKRPLPRPRLKQGVGSEGDLPPYTTIPHSDIEPVKLFWNAYVPPELESMSVPIPSHATSKIEPPTRAPLSMRIP